MRWEGLFADLEGRLAAEERRELDDEVAERTRRERALVELGARLSAAVGAPLRLGLVGGLLLQGELIDVGDGWVLVRAGATAREVLVPTSAIATLTPLGRESEPGRVARRFALGSALRALSRDRATVGVTLVGGGPLLVGTIDTVGADHLDLAEHPEGVPRRQENVRAVTTVPFGALLSVESRR
ncbi:MAG TPA: hypothetical protein VLQ78_06440 [Ornithinibacter sp.]|nr:hypothetical protein [Ornithinibacter sp.]